ncbi:MAG: phosphoribosylanthranilate isomerase [Candidatus Omnitrophica bacterium]|nr:phosphoribosylanthranilate isomerase [Candidatus Omnitrophota bacterium]
MVKVKICGITNLRDALKAHELGADFIGFIFFENSPRKIDTEKARIIIEDLPKDLLKTGLFLNQNHEEVESIAKRCHLDALQLHGEEDPAYCAGFKNNFKVIKSFKVKDAQSVEKADKYDTVDYYLFDTYVKGIPGGTGINFDWDVLKGFPFKKPFFLAGGLKPENVAEAIKKVTPYGVDVSSGVEKSAGKKDYRLLKEFIDNAKRSQNTR